MLIAISAGGCASSNAAASPSPSAARDAPQAWFTSLPSDARVADFRPGRFAITIDQDETNSCSMSWASASSRATVVLELAADGSATGCRGRHYQSVDGPNDERPSAPTGQGGKPLPRVHETRYVEQQGMRGRWHRDGRGVVIDFEPAAGVCATRAENVSPNPWHLRCAALERAGRATTVRGPLLVCGWMDVSRQPATPLLDWPATAGYATQEFIPGFWLVLAPGAGVRVTERGLDESLHPPMDVKWVPAATPIPFDDWAATGP